MGLVDASAQIRCRELLPQAVLVAFCSFLIETAIYGKQQACYFHRWAMDYLSLPLLNYFHTKFSQPFFFFPSHCIQIKKNILEVKFGISGTGNSAFKPVVAHRSAYV